MNSGKPGKMSINQVFAMLQELERFEATGEDLAQILRNPNFTKRMVDFLKNGGAPKAHESLRGKGKYFFGPQEWDKHFGIRLKKEEYEEPVSFERFHCQQSISRVNFMTFYCPSQKSLDYSTEFWSEGWVNPSSLTIVGLEKELEIYSTPSYKKKTKEILETPFSEHSICGSRGQWKALALDKNYIHEGKDLMLIKENVEEKYSYSKIKIASVWEVLLVTIIHCRLFNKVPPFFAARSITCRDRVKLENGSVEGIDKRAKLYCKTTDEEEGKGVEIKVDFEEAHNNSRKTVVPSLELKRE